MERILMGSVAAFAALTLICYILIVLHVPFLIIPISLIAAFFAFKPIVKTIKLTKIKLNFQTIIILIVFTLGITGQMAVISPSGVFKNGDLLFWSSHGHDATWHIALMEEIKRGWPFQNPIFSGEKLTNYHFFSDILPAMVSKYLPISNLNLYFRIFPFFYSLFLGASAYFLTKKLTKSFSASIWATIFTYFAGSFGYVIGKGESVFWATQPQSASGNPPQIISDFLVLTIIYFVILLGEQRNKSKSRIIFAICTIFVGTLVSFKVYAAVVVFGGLAVAGIWQLIKERKLQLLILTLVSGILALVLYLPNTSNSASFLIFQPWWYIRTMIVEPSRLNLLDWELRRQTYIYEHNWKRVIWLEGMGFLIFFFGNLGVRFIGLWDFLKSHIIFKAIIVLSFILPLLFLQKGVASNTSQFLQYFVLLFGILAGITTAKIVAKLKFLIPIIIVLMIPTQIGLLREFYSRPAFAKITSSELLALEFIKDNTSPDTVIVTPPYNQYLNLGGITPNIWDWFDTSYLSAFSARRTYFDDYEQADIMNYNWRLREEVKKIIFENVDQEKVKTALLQTSSNILYFPKVLRPKVDPESIGLTLFFENEETEVWKAN